MKTSLLVTDVTLGASVHWFRTRSRADDTAHSINLSCLQPLTPRATGVFVEDGIDRTVHSCLRLMSIMIN